MRKRFALLILIWLAGISPGLIRAQTDVSELEPGTWAELPVAGAVCGFGDPWQFFTRPADPDRLIIYFQGGGACWNGDTCTPDGTFEPTVGTADEEAGQYDGIFAFDNPENPVAEYSVVFIPYCTGDVHTGTRTEATSGLINFTGALNARAALDWTYANYPDAERVIVTGSSAGAYGAAHFAADVFAAYPDADHLLLGDAGVGVTHPGWDGLATWGTLDSAPDFDGLAADNFTDGLYAGTATLFPDARIAQFTTFADTVQAGFFALQGGNLFQWPGRMIGQLTALGDTHPNFSAYVGWGDLHVILPRPEFYTMQVNGVRFRDWFADLAAGEPGSTIICTDCTDEELYTP